MERRYDIMVISYVRLLSEFLSSTPDSAISLESDLRQLTQVSVSSTAGLSHGGTDGDVISQTWGWGSGVGAVMNPAVMSEVSSLKSPTPCVGSWWKINNQVVEN